MDQSRTAVFVLSTGRCGTQWLYRLLRRLYSPVAVVTHEPIRAAYQPKRYLRAYDHMGELAASRPVSRHLSRIKKILRSKAYIETGWPCYPAIPLLISQLDRNVRIVHLVRHPIYVALSLATHPIYIGRGWPTRAAIDPFDPGVIQKELGPKWTQMEVLEKCLFWWTEINLYAQELKERYPDVEFHLTRYEDLFGPDSAALRHLIEFMGLPYDAKAEEHRSQIEDRYHYRSRTWQLERITEYPRTMALAHGFGYEIADLPVAQLAERYFRDSQEPRRSKWRALFHRVRQIGQ